MLSNSYFYAVAHRLPFIGRNLTLLSRGQKLALAEKNNLQAITFPCISTDIYNFSNKLAVEIAVQTSLNYLSGHQSTLRITFCFFLETDLEIYRALLDRV
jgi:O-acetyl-ADP-ribose deacetylase (regulator of RNase III)